MLAAYTPHARFSQAAVSAREKRQGGARNDATGQPRAQSKKPQNTPARTASYDKGKRNTHGLPACRARRKSHVACAAQPLVVVVPPPRRGAERGSGARGAGRREQRSTERPARETRAANCESAPRRDSPRARHTLGGHEHRRGHGLGGRGLCGLRCLGSGRRLLVVVAHGGRRRRELQQRASPLEPSAAPLTAADSPGPGSSAVCAACSYGGHGGGTFDDDDDGDEDEDEDDEYDGGGARAATAVAATVAANDDVGSDDRYDDRYFFCIDDDEIDATDDVVDAALEAVLVAATAVQMAKLYALADEEVACLCRARAPRGVRGALGTGSARMLDGDAVGVLVERDDGRSKCHTRICGGWRSSVLMRVAVASAVGRRPSIVRS